MKHIKPIHNYDLSSTGREKNEVKWLVSNALNKNHANKYRTLPLQHVYWSLLQDTFRPGDIPPHKKTVDLIKKHIHSLNAIQRLWNGRLKYIAGDKRITPSTWDFLLYF